MAQSRPVITCTPEYVLGIQPCVAQLAQTDKLAAIAMLLCVINNAGETGCTANELMADCVCWSANTSLDPLTAIVNMLLDYAVKAGYIPAATSMMSEGNCFAQLADPQLIGIILCQFCAFIKNLENPQ
jgi:hypothetical protein